MIQSNVKSNVMSGTTRRVFAQMVEKPQATKKWLLFPVSLLFHFCLIASVVVIPLMSSDEEKPELKIMDIFLTANMAPPPPSVPAGKKGNTTKSKHAEEKKQQVAVDPTRLIEPVTIRDTIEEEDLLTDFGVGNGGEIIGAPVGVEGGVIGGSIFGDPDAVNNATPITVAKPPTLLKKFAPDYPAVALRARIQGDVLVEAVTNVAGVVVNAKVINGNPLLRQAALDAVYKWLWEPYIVNGLPKPVKFVVTVKFTLNQ